MLLSLCHVLYPGPYGRWESRATTGAWDHLPEVAQGGEGRRAGALGGQVPADSCTF